jgi:predicted DNA-binding transcriptional regulator AlpA
MADRLVGAAEIADLLGVSRQRVNELARTSQEFPSPVAELAAGRIWERESIEAWARRRGYADEVRIVAFAGVAVESPATPEDLSRAVAELRAGQPVLVDCRGTSALAFQRIADAALGVSLAIDAAVHDGDRTLLLIPPAVRLGKAQKKAIERYLERTGAQPTNRGVPMTEDKVAAFVHSRFGVDLGPKTVAALREAASSEADIANVQAEVTGRNTITGKPKTVTVRLADIAHMSP